MSSYNAIAKRPKGTDFENVAMIDDYFGHHQYGVKFPDGSIYREGECVKIDLSGDPIQINEYKYTNIYPFNLFHGKLREAMEETITLIVEDYADERETSGKDARRL